MDENPASTLASVNATLGDLESAMAPLLARPLSETREGMGPLERAKMDVLLAFAANNLVWVYLKSRGIDPDNHDVAKELERIKTYYGKVRDVEAPQERTQRIDTEAAKRFITAAIPKSQRLDLPTTSAAATAAAQLAAANDDSGSDRRSNRFRFIADEAVKVAPGSGAEGEAAAAAALLADVEGEIAANAGGSGASTPDKRRKGKGKRKRAMDVA